MTATSPALRLGFRLPEFVRYAWVDDAARRYWEPRLEVVKDAWSRVELASVRHDVRPAAVRVVHPAAIAAPDGELAGLEIELLGAVAMSGPYMASVAPPDPGRPYALQVAAGRRGAARALAGAWRDGDQAEVGRLLGFPACCARFFERVWVDERWVDTTWPMAMGTTAREPQASDDADVVVQGPTAANILLRWLGLRAVPHLPCAFDCAATAMLGYALAGVFKREGLDEPLALLGEMLEWPVEWSALHGIAEIKTPVVRITAHTDATAGRLRVRRHGTRWPEHGAHGLAFPYRPPGAPLRLPHHRALERLND